MIDEVTLILTTPEAVMFRDFQQFHETFALLVSKGVFDIKNGSATINFGPDGTVSSIVRNDKIFDRYRKELPSL